MFDPYNTCMSMSTSNFLTNFFRIMGRPIESDWPQDVSLPWNSFKAFPPKPVDTYIPEIDPVARDLFEVRLFNIEKGSIAL